MFNRMRPKFLNRLFPGWFQVMSVVSSLASNNFWKVLGGFKIMSAKGTTYTKYLLIAPYNFELTSFYWHYEFQMNFDNQGIASGTFMRQRWALLLLYRAVYFTEAYYKMHCITMGYTIPLRNIENMQKKVVLQQKPKEKLLIYWGFEMPSVLLCSLKIYLHPSLLTFFLWLNWLTRWNFFLRK